jgi:hypothetical protein
MEKHKKVRTVFLLIVLCGASMVIGDAVLTPAISGRHYHNNLLIYHSRSVFTISVGFSCFLIIVLSLQFYRLCLDYRFELLVCGMVSTYHLGELRKILAILKHTSGCTVSVQSQSYRHANQIHNFF